MALLLCWIFVLLHLLSSTQAFVAIPKYRGLYASFSPLNAIDSNTITQSKPGPTSSVKDNVVEKAAEDIEFHTCTLMDMPEIMRLSYAEFKSRCDTEQCREELRAEIRSLFLPKMILNPFMGHSIIGLKKPGSKELLGFVDLSLQTQSLDALKPLPYILRVGKYGSAALRPYLCNLLVAPEYRRQGLGKRLVDRCIDTAREWGHSELFLHVQETTPAPLNLYLKMGFVRSLPAEGSYATLLRKSFQKRKAR